MLLEVHSPEPSVIPFVGPEHTVLSMEWIWALSNAVLVRHCFKNSWRVKVLLLSHLGIKMEKRDMHWKDWKGGGGGGVDLIPLHSHLLWECSDVLFWVIWKVRIGISASPTAYQPEYKCKRLSSCSSKGSNDSFFHWAHIKPCYTHSPQCLLYLCLSVYLGECFHNCHSCIKSLMAHFSLKI